jgi:hypothetical protein
LLRTRDLDNDLAGPGKAKLVAGNFLDFVWIGLQLFYFLPELQILLVQAVNIGVYFLDLLLRAAHSQIAVRAKNVVDYKDEHEQCQERAPVLAQERLEFLGGHLLQF